jgi:hypothetical protein
MSNGEKAGRVAQVFCVQLRNKFLSEQFCFHFLLTTVCFIQISVFAFLYGVSDIFMSAFQMELNDYLHFDFTEYGTLCSTGQHCPGFPRVQYDALIRLGYDGDSGVPLATVHGPRHGPVRVQRDDTLRPHGAMVGVHHRQGA